MKNQVPKEVSSYLSRIGRQGGKKSRRELDPITAQRMCQVREARRAFKKYHARCFWSYDPNFRITSNEVRWVGEQLKKQGDRKLWLLGVKLCR